MLHEILLSLSGHSSPIFEKSTGDDGNTQDGFPLLSASEKALLQPVARLSKLHRVLRSHTARISSRHSSTVCRAVSTTISTLHLGSFQKKILEVEKSILAKDSGYVGGYGIVPLSTIVGEFSPWIRRMEWLWATSMFILPHQTRKPEASSGCSGAALINYLRAESQTGYVDVEEITFSLIKSAESAWMRQLSVFILSGRLPPLGREDFFIQGTESGEGAANSIDYVLHRELLPEFISPSTAASILFIGKSLNHIRARGKLPAFEESKVSGSHMTLHGDFIRRLSAVQSPFPTADLSSAISDIRLSLSQTALSRLLPLHKIMEVLSLLHDFVLLGRGEFAMALVSYADKTLSSKFEKDLLPLKETEVSEVLNQVWSELYSLQNAEDPVDDELDIARELLKLSVASESVSDNDMSASQTSSRISNVSFGDILFGSPTSLYLRVQPPLDLFLSQTDMTTYSKIHSYLLGIRRAQIRLGDLWKRTSLRRAHPAPCGPPLSNKPSGQRILKQSRERQAKRAASMRPIWAAGSAVLFVLSELGSYLQGEVIGSSWRHFHQWLEGKRPTSSGRDSRPGTSSSSFKRSVGADDHTPPRSYDPETITMAHRSYLLNLTQFLFLNDTSFTRTLRTLLSRTDQFVALLTRLQEVQQNIDLEVDAGVFDSYKNYSEDEDRLNSEIYDVRVLLNKAMNELIARLRDVDDKRLTTKGITPYGQGNADMGYRDGKFEGNPDFDSHINGTYVPLRAVGVDRLLIRLEFGGASEEHNIGGAEDFGGT